VASKLPKKSICFYFEVHQPLRLNNFSYFDINKNKDYFDISNKEILNKVAKKCYFPTNKLILKLISKYPEFRCAYSLSGVFIDQCEMYNPKLLESFKELVATNKVEILSETYYHSLSYLYKKDEFIDQILLHRKKIWQLFKKKPQVFRNTELIYSNKVAEYAKRLGFKAVLSEGWEKYLHWRSPNFLYKAKPSNLGAFNEKMLINKRFREEIDQDIFLLLKNYKLSDDIAFRFSNKKWTSYPLTAEKYANWIQKAPGETINLFMDYETFGEHQWEDSGIFKFLEKLPEELKKRNIGFRTPSETIKQLSVKDTISIPNLLSWADFERDISAWNDNKMQKEALKKVYELSPLVKKVITNISSTEKAQKFLDTWRYLQTSDHFYYMSTKYWSDGDVHTYFSHYESPYDAYINYMNILNDFRQKLLLAK